MTIGLFERYAEEMDSLRAERLLDAAQAATAQHQKEPWWDALAERARGVPSQSVEPVAQDDKFMFNDKHVSFDALFTQLSRALGGGVSH